MDKVSVSKSLLTSCYTFLTLYKLLHLEEKNEAMEDTLDQLEGILEPNKEP